MDFQAQQLRFDKGKQNFQVSEELYTTDRRKDIVKDEQRKLKPSGLLKLIQPQTQHHNLKQKKGQKSQIN